MMDPTNPTDSQPTQQDLVMLANEYRKLCRQLDDKTSQLTAATADNARGGQFPIDFATAKPRRYNLDYEFTPGSLDPKEATVQIENGTLFRCSAIETWVKASGTAKDFFNNNVDLQAQLTLTSTARLGYFDFFARLRDTGTDREWFDQPQHSLFLGGGYLGPLWFPRRNLMSGGTVVSGLIMPILSRASGTLISTIQSFQVQIGLIGHEVVDGSEL